jgi:hypothetical protein
VIHLIVSLGFPLTVRLDFSFRECLSDNRFQGIDIDIPKVSFPSMMLILS